MQTFKINSINKLMVITKETAKQVSYNYLSGKKQRKDFKMSKANFAKKFEEGRYSEANFDYNFPVAADPNASSTEALVNQLKGATNKFKDDYIRKVLAWAEKDHARFMDFYTKWGKGYYRTSKPTSMSVGYANMEEGVDYIIISEEEYNKLSRKYWNAPSWKTNLDEVLKRAKRDAELHYNGSIFKLASRLVKKGVIAENIKPIDSVYLDPNLNMEVTDGNVTVKCWTIIASGPIQRPHYRYLVK